MTLRFGTDGVRGHADELTDDLVVALGRAAARVLARTDQSVELLVQGVERVVILKMEQTEPYLKARVQPLPLPEDQGTEVEALFRAVLDYSSGNQCRAAAILGINRGTLRKKLRQFGLSG